MAKLVGKWIESSAALAGSPTTTTQADGDNSTKIATTAFVIKTAGSESAKIGHLVNLSGVAANSDNLGAFTGSVLSNSETVKSADQKLSDAVEAAQSQADAASTSAATANSDLAAHVIDTSTHGVGTIVGTSESQALSNKTIDADQNSISNIANSQIKAAAGIVESKLDLDYSTSSLNDGISSASAKIGHLETLSGVASGSDNLGAFTGSHLSASESVKSAFQALSNAIDTATNAPNNKEIKTLSAGDISAGYIDLAHVASANSLSVIPVGGPEQEEGVDYTLSEVSNKTRVTFAGDLASILVEGDKVQFQYEY